MSPLTLTLLVSALCTLGYGWPTGAPTERCGSMTPGHGTEQTGANPYSLEVSATEYSPGKTITVTVKGGAFKGLLIQARKTGTTDIVGTFTAPNAATNTKLLTCGSVAGSAVTHSSTDSKTDLALMWNPPSSGMDSIEFVATVNQEKTTWWKNTKSAEVKYKMAAPEPETSAEPEGSAEPETSTPENNNNPNAASGLTGFLAVTFLFIAFAQFVL